MLWAGLDRMESGVRCVVLELLVSNCSVLLNQLLSAQNPAKSFIALPHSITVILAYSVGILYSVRLFVNPSVSVCTSVES